MIRSTVVLLITVVALGCSNRATTSVGGDDGGSRDDGSGASWPDAGPLIDAATLAPGCAEIRGRGRRRISPDLAAEVLISDDLGRVVLLSRLDGASGLQIEVVTLPSAQVQQFSVEATLEGASSIRSAVDHQQRGGRWIRGQRAVLAVTGSVQRASHGDLSVIDLDDGSVATISKRICGALLDRTGRDVFVVHHCDTGEGTLTHIDLDADSRQDLGSRVRADSISLSPDGQLAFVDRLAGGPTLVAGRFAEAGSLQPIASGVVERSVQFVSDTLLLWRTTDGEETLFARVGAKSGQSGQSGQTVPVGAGYTFGYDPPYYRVNSAGRQVLAAGPEWFDMPTELFALPLDGSDARLLADDVMLQNPVMSSITPFPPLTADGRFAIYQMADVFGDAEPFPIGLASVRLADGRKDILSSHTIGITSVAVSPVGSRVVLSEGDFHDGQLVMVDLDSGERQPLLDLPGYRGAFLPRGDGVLAIGYEEPLTHLTACMQQPAVCQILGSWDESPLAGQYAVSSDGCFVVLSTDQGDAPGTYLVPLMGDGDDRDP